MLLLGVLGEMKRKAGPKNAFFPSELKHIRGTQKINGQSYGISLIPLNIKEKVYGFFLCQIGQSSIFGSIFIEKIPIVPLYFAAKRPVVKRNDQYLMVDDDRFQIFED